MVRMINIDKRRPTAICILLNGIDNVFFFYKGVPFKVKGNSFNLSTLKVHETDTTLMIITKDTKIKYLPTYRTDLSSIFDKVAPIDFKNPHGIFWNKTILDKIIVTRKQPSSEIISYEDIRKGETVSAVIYNPINETTSIEYGYKIRGWNFFAYSEPETVIAIKQNNGSWIVRNINTESNSEFFTVETEDILTYIDRYLSKVKRK